MLVIHHQEPLPLPHDIELEYDTTIEPSVRANIDVDRHINEGAITQARMIPNPHPNFQCLSM